MATDYLYSYAKGGPYGASFTRRSRAYILGQAQFALVHPELMARLFNLADDVVAQGGDFGFGGGWRSSAQQYNLFKSRYTRGVAGATLYWDGSPSWPQDAGWYKHTSGAPSAPPGRSYHESTTAKGTGFALAVDMVGDHTLGNALAAKHQLKHFGNINGEPWHYQPIEIANARRNYTNNFESIPSTPPKETPVALIHFRTSPTNLTIWSSDEGSLVAHRIEARQFAARGLDASKIAVLSALEAAKYVFSNGFTDESVR